LGESVAAFVVKSPEADITENDIIDFCKTRIASSMVPKSIKFVDQLPRSLGKVVKKILREQYVIKKE
jgi:acyl-CoA synthetase (AMP-forming)/AMP-acid ligase II